MLIALDLTKVREYVSRYDSGEKKTIFKLGVIDSITRAGIRDKRFEWTGAADSVAGLQPQMKSNIHKVNVEYVRYGLRGWENFVNERGEPVQFETESEVGPGGVVRTVVKESLLQLIPSHIIDELADEIARDNTLTEDDQKN
jgi:hypothetical protein